ncbi:LacI family transcriptional regulator [Paenibacillus nanensis]|uniref:LacI family transcriptional regulator n=1 Tax=Paenibacillus nanensis TaxID=393251 RepID=A0A3A1VJE1_9BACL|nr:LacI family DNA-binding transcriptional regulator [Paenibacillus nanensis]RIX60434.1 LacI family transcriptional regulator [Paenibacillus nanensis]
MSSSHKKATMKDIAKAAQVSVATVSYVLNCAPNQTIPAETKQRVLETAKELQYVPNLAARSLIKNRTGLVGILVNRSRDERWWEQLAISRDVDALERGLTRLGYHVVLASLDADNPNMAVISERKLDAVFVLGAKEQTFHDISVHFSAGVPLIVVNSYIDDPLFYKIVYDYERAVDSALTKQPDHRSFLIMDRLSQGAGEALCSQLSLSSSQVLVLEDERQLPDFLMSQQGSGIILNEGIAVLAARWMESPRFTTLCTAGCPELLHALPGSAYVSFGDGKAQSSIALMQALLNEQTDPPAEKYMRIKPL